MVPTSSVTARNQGEGTFHDQRTKLLLKSLVPFRVDKKQTGRNVGSVKTTIQGVRDDIFNAADKKTRERDKSPKYPRTPVLIDSMDVAHPL